MSNSDSIPMPTHKGFKDLTGQVFSRLTVMGYGGKHLGRLAWLCSCECGNQTVVVAKNLVNRNTKSCGCGKNGVKDYQGSASGRSQSPEYQAFRDMWSRCTNPKNPGYAHYSCRTPPEEWKNFPRFLDDMGPRPSSLHSLERVNNDAPYGPENCTWALESVQANNTSRNIKLAHSGSGTQRTLAQACREGCLSYTKTLARLRAGWSVSRATDGKYTEIDGNSKYARPPMKEPDELA